MARYSIPLLFLTLRLALAGSAADVARQLQQISLDTSETYRVVDLNFNKAEVKIYFTSGYLVFAQPVAGIRPGAVFVADGDAGDAEVLLMPPVRSERLSLATFTESPTLEEHFKGAVLIFTDGTADELLARIRSSPVLKKSPEMGALMADQWNNVMRNLAASFATRMVHDLLSRDRPSGFFYTAVSGDKLGNFDVLYDPTSREQIFAGKLVYRDNRTYFDTWTSFPSRLAAAAAAEVGERFALDNFRIDATIDADLAMKAVTRATFKAKRTPGLALPFLISQNMRVTEASIDGKPAEIFARESLRSNLIASNDNQQFLVVPETPLDPSRPHEIEFHHEGSVILKAGAGVYYVASRGNWYPRGGTEFANYDLTFRYPKNLTLVSTGNPVEDRTDGAWRITHRKTQSPIRFAGFNLGDFQSVTVAQGGYKIEVYANRHLEAALQPKASPPASANIGMPPFGSVRARRPSDPLLSETPPPAPPDPAARLTLLARGVADAMEFMTQKFGPPPIRNLDITPIPGTFGQGFPGLVYLSTLTYLNPEQRPNIVRAAVEQTFYSELLEMHEVAHQWWGNLVIPASYQDEWLMESLANYSALLMLEKRQGIKALETVLESYKSQLLTKSEDGRTLESAGPITWGYRLQSSMAPHAWRPVTYEKGTWIIHMLRRRLGDEKFLSLLHELCSRYRFGAIATDQFRELAAEYAPPKSPDHDFKNFFENWVYGTGIPAVKLTYAVHGLRLTGTLTDRDVADDFTAIVPVEVQTRRQKSVYWLPIGSDPTPFSIPLKVPPTKVSLLVNDCLMTPAK